MNCLPSELLNEDYNTISNIIQVISSRSQKTKDKTEKYRNNKHNRF